MKPNVQKRRHENRFTLARVLFAMTIVAAALLGTSGCSASLATQVDDWVVAETEHVRLRAELPAPDAQKLVIEMQEIRDAFASEVLKCAFSRDIGAIEVTALSPEQFETIAPPAASAFYLNYGASWVDYPPQIVIPTTFATTSRQTYQHELTHRLNAVCFPNAPVWVNEGLAKFLETALVENGQLSIGLPAYLFVSPNEPFTSGEYQGMRIQTVPRDFVPSAPTLLGLDHKQFYARSDSFEQIKRTIGNYSAAWSLVHLLELGDSDLRQRFTGYLGSLHSRNRSPEVAWEEEFRGIDLNARLNAYQKRDDLPYVDFKYRPPAREKPRIRSMQQGEAHLHWSWLLGPKYRDQALVHASAALNDASSAALARAVAAGIYADSEQFGKAEAEVQKGLASNPNDARLLHAQLLLYLDVWKRAGKRKLLDDIVERFRPAARTASQLNALGLAELARDEPEAALQYSNRAAAERPGCWSCLVTQAMALAQLTRSSEALSSLELASRWISHDNPDALTKINTLADKIRRNAERR